MAVEIAALVTQFVISIITAVVVTAVGYLLFPSPKNEKSADVTDIKAPTAEAGRPIPVLFGELRITGLNCLWYGEPRTYRYKIEV